MKIYELIEEILKTLILLMAGNDVCEKHGNFLNLGGAANGV